MSEQNMTKGEMLVNGMEKIKEGLEMISKLGDKQELIKTLVGSQAAANRLKDLVKSNVIFQNMVLSMVSARNSRLNAETVQKVITDFMDVLFDLSRPYKDLEATPDEEEKS
jgi:hypothetical protein